MILFSAFFFPALLPCFRSENTLLGCEDYKDIQKQTSLGQGNNSQCKTLKCYRQKADKTKTCLVCPLAPHGIGNGGTSVGEYAGVLGARLQCGVRAPCSLSEFTMSGHNRLVNRLRKAVHESAVWPYRGWIGERRNSWLKPLGSS